MTPHDERVLSVLFTDAVLAALPVIRQGVPR
jgi:hypothetical protein